MKTILFIEDNEDILDNLTEYFEIQGYTIIGAKNGRLGFDLALELVPDLIICDVQMPLMDGYEVLHALLHTVKTFNIPFIFSSSVCEKVDKEQAIKLGADDFITKPFELESLLKMVELRIKSGSLRQGQKISLDL